MAYSAGEARERLLSDVGKAGDQLAFAVACLGEAYEQLDENTADALERLLFRPAQSAYGRCRRTYLDFAARYGLPAAPLPPGSPGPHSPDPRTYISRAVEASEGADQWIAGIQDSMMPVEVGDTELRAGLSETRALVADVPARGRQLLRTLGR